MTHASKPAKPAVPAPRATREGSKRVDGFGTYEEALRFLLDRPNLERRRLGKGDAQEFKLERMGELMEALGHPERSFKAVHVAGSKGKGSVCEMAASCLEACGLTTGLYTSPHLVDLRERIRINRAMISREELRALIAQVASVVPKIKKGWGEPTFFELATAAAFLHFAQMAVDVAVVEVGLGGRLDSTNVITPEACAITAIQMEHAAILGGTREAIAREKAGIIKPGVPVVTMPQDPSVIDVFRSVAQERGSRLLVLGTDIEFSHRFESDKERGGHIKVVLTTERSTFEHLPVPLMGEHQAYNCGLALALVDLLRERAFPKQIGERAVAAGLARTPNHGRLEVVSRSPRIVVDGAHNPESIGALVKTMGTYLRPDSMVFVFGCASDKDVPGMLEQIARGADKVIFTKAAGNPRAADPRELARKFVELTGRMAQVAPGVREAIELARSAVGRGDAICVTGSFYIVGEAKALLAPPLDPVAEPKVIAPPATQPPRRGERRG